MKYLVSRRQTHVTIPTTSEAYFTAAAVFAVLGVVLWLAEQSE